MAKPIKAAMQLPRSTVAVTETVKGVPKLVMSTVAKAVETYDPALTFPFSYEIPGHDDLPHVVKFSGGRSSGLLLFILLENGFLQRQRGDVIIFNDTSAEHPETYLFSAKCKRIAEERYGIPFFWIQFQTYEDARSGEWIRLPAYRLVKPVPWSKEEPHGYHFKGEAFEEMLSWSGYVPNQFQRTCTQNLKLGVTRQFLQDWFACKEGIDRLGHYGKDSRMEDDAMFAAHKKHRGMVPKEIFLRKRAFVRQRPVFRPAQSFTEYSCITQPLDNPKLRDKQFGGKAFFGEEGVEYLSFVGFRNDEMLRVIKAQKRNSDDSDTNRYVGEHVYMPLAKMGVTEEDVKAFWDAQNWGLMLPSEAGLSNCVYCFMKGAGNLRKIHLHMESSKEDHPLSLDTPCDINWWKRIESHYGRDMEAENRVMKKPERAGAVIGFFGIDSKFSYDLLEKSGRGKVDITPFAKTVLPCDCTD